MKHSVAATACLLLLLIFGCSSSHKVEVAPVEVKPIHITIDVNVRVDRALDDFFSDVDEAPAAPEATNAQ
jgi:Skp family chaperone for outer membrane proteins